MAAKVTNVSFFHVALVTMVYFSTETSFIDEVGPRGYTIVRELLLQGQLRKPTSLSFKSPFNKGPLFHRDILNKWCELRYFLEESFSTFSFDKHPLFHGLVVHHWHQSSTSARGELDTPGADEGTNITGWCPDSRGRYSRDSQDNRAPRWWPVLCHAIHDKVELGKWWIARKWADGVKKNQKRFEWDNI